MSKAKSRISWPKLVASILLCQIVGNLGTIFTLPALTNWYVSLTKPFFNPPNWLFGPVWLILYTLMGISLYLIWNKLPSIKEPIKNKALTAFFIQLSLNLLWSLLFFGLHSPLYGFIDIIFLWSAIVFTIHEFSKISKTASNLLIPYIIWVSFAAILNLSILILNFR